MQDTQTQLAPGGEWDPDRPAPPIRPLWAGGHSLRSPSPVLGGRAQSQVPLQAPPGGGGSLRSPGPSAGARSMAWGLLAWSREGDGPEVPGQALSGAGCCLRSPGPVLGWRAWLEVPHQDLLGGRWSLRSPVKLCWAGDAAKGPWARHRGRRHGLRSSVKSIALLFPLPPPTASHQHWTGTNAGSVTSLAEDAGRQLHLSAGRERTQAA